MAGRLASGLNPASKRPGLWGNPGLWHGQKWWAWHWGARFWVESELRRESSAPKSINSNNTCSNISNCNTICTIIWMSMTCMSTIKVSINSTAIGLGNNARSAYRTIEGRQLLSLNWQPTRYNIVLHQRTCQCRHPSRAHRHVDRGWDTIPF